MQIFCRFTANTRRALIVGALFATCGGVSCHADGWNARAGVPGGKAAKGVQLVTYRQQLYGAYTRSSAKGVDVSELPEVRLVYRLVVRDVGPNRVVLLSAERKPLRVDFTTSPWRVIEAEDESGGTVWDVIVHTNGRDKRGRVILPQWSIQHEGKQYFLTFNVEGTKPEHVVRTPGEAIVDLYPLTIGESPPQKLYLQYGDLEKSTQ